MKRWNSLLGSLCLLAIVSASPGDQQLTTQPDVAQGDASLAGSIEGVVHLPTPAFASQMVLYLEAREGQTVLVSKTSATISQKGARFSPSLLVVCVHRTVDFLNDEARPIEHNVFSNSPTTQFDLGLFEPGQKRSVTFDKPGPVLLYCSIHRHMDGVVYVTPTPFYDVVDPDGTTKDIAFKIEGVPPGKWIVHTWQRRRRYLETSAVAVVSAGQKCNVDLQLASK